MRAWERNALGLDLRRWINGPKVHDQRGAYHHILLLPHEYFSTASCQVISTDDFSYFHHLLPNAAQPDWFSTYGQLKSWTDSFKTITSAEAESRNVRWLVC